MTLGAQKGFLDIKAIIVKTKINQSMKTALPPPKTNKAQINRT